MVCANGMQRNWGRAIYSFPVWLILACSLQACIKAPTITQTAPVTNANAPVQRPAGVEVVPIKVGIYYEPEFREFVHQDYTTGRNKLEIPVGAASTNHFDKVFAALFSQTVEIDGRPPYGKAKYGGDTSNLSAVMEVRIEDFAYNWQPMSTGPFTASVAYRLILYSPSGNTVSSWTVSGSDTAKIGFTEHALTFTSERTDKAMRAASAKFMTEFEVRPEVERWLALIANPARDSQSGATLSSVGGDSNKARDRLEDVTVEATLYSQHGTQATPYNSGLRSEILTAIVTVTNSGTRSIVIRPFDITLGPRPGARLHPVSPNRAARRVYQAPEHEDSEAVGVLINPALGALLTLGEGSEKDSAIKDISDFFKSNQLKDTTLGPNQSVSGHVYFEALGTDGEFKEAELRVRVGETASTQNFDASLMVGRGTAWSSGFVAASFGAATVASARTLTSQRTSPATKQKVNPAPAAAGPQRIDSAPQLLDLLSNTTASGTSESGTEFATYSRADGGMVARTAKGSVDEGVWEITPDARYCRQWNNWRDGARDCFHVYLMKDGRFRFKGIDKPYDSEVSITPGDSRGLGRRMSAAEGVPLVVAGVAASRPAAQLAIGSSTVAKGAAATASVESTQSRNSSVAAVNTPTPARGAHSGSLRVAILPFAAKYPTWNSASFTEEELEKFSREFVSRRDGYELTYSYYQRELGGGPELKAGSLWDGNLFKKPRTQEIYSTANLLDADMALTYFHAPRTSDGYAFDLYSVDAYLFDLTYQRTYHGRGHERNYKEVTAGLFDDLTADRQKSGGTRMAGEVTVATGASSTQTTMVSAATAAQSTPVNAVQPAVPLEDGQLSHEQLRQSLSGNTVSGRTDGFIDFHIYYSPDGKMSGKAKGTRYDTGEWQAYPDGTYCRRWDRWLSGARECYKVFMSGGNRIQFQKVGSDSRSTHTLRFGDPENLKGRI